ncbi:MAG: DUF177 domain-containing protein [Sphingomonadales bacterium]
MHDGQEVDFNFRFRLPQMKEPELSLRLAAGKVERDLLAKRFKLVALDRLEATVELRRLAGHQGLEMKGRLSAEAAQKCVVTLKPVRSQVADQFLVRFVPRPMDPDAHNSGKTEIEIDPDEDDIEYMDDEVVDLGETVAQHLSLALNPYPRCDNAEVPEALRAVAEPVIPRSPFAALHKLQDRT